MKPIFRAFRTLGSFHPLLLCFVFYHPLASCVADNIPVPSTGADGPTASSDPFAFGISTSSRFQQVYDTSAFSSGIPQGGWITGLFWAADLVFGRGDWGATLPDTEISLSITARRPDQLSSTFADNLGLSTTVVYPRGPLLLDSAGRGSRVDVIFQTPFFYDPNQGSLLLEIRNYQPTDPLCISIPQCRVGPLDAYDDVGDSVSRVFTYNVNAATGSADTLGLTTYFVVTPVPEPSTLALLGIALGLCGVTWTRSKRSRSKH